MHAYLVFVPHKDTAFRVSFLKEDARTSYPRKFMVRDGLVLTQIAARLNGDIQELRRILRGWGQGSLVIHPGQEQVKWMEKQR